MAAPYHFFVVDDENAGCVFHGTTSLNRCNQIYAIHVPLGAPLAEIRIKIGKTITYAIRSCGFEILAIGLGTVEV